MKPVKIYTTSYCPFCRRAKDFFASQNVGYEEVDVTEDSALREKLVELSGGMKTVPQIFIGDTHVGGYTDVMALHQSGKLVPLLSDDSTPAQR